MKRQSPITPVHFSYLFLFAAFLFMGGCEKIVSDPLNTGNRGGDRMSYADGLSESGSAGGDYYPGTEKFGELTYNGFVYSTEDNLSTFGIDVDNGSYTFGRKKINEGHLPPKESVRVEEYINYFRQDYDPPVDAPFQSRWTVHPHRFAETVCIFFGLASRVKYFQAKSENRGT